MFYLLYHYILTILPIVAQTLVMRGAASTALGGPGRDPYTQQESKAHTLYHFDHSIGPFYRDTFDPPGSWLEGVLVPAGGYGMNCIESVKYFKIHILSTKPGAGRMYIQQMQCLSLS
jgi:hypothetical protein